MAAPSLSLSGNPFPRGYLIGPGMQRGITGDWTDYRRVCSNEFVAPKVLSLCPADRQNPLRATWPKLDGDHQYPAFLGLDADGAKPQAILAGDRNVSSSTGDGREQLFFHAFPQDVD